MKTKLPHCCDLGLMQDWWNSKNVFKLLLKEAHSPLPLTCRSYSADKVGDSQGMVFWGTGSTGPYSWISSWESTANFGKQSGF